MAAQCRPGRCWSVGLCRPQSYGQAVGIVLPACTFIPDWRGHTARPYWAHRLQLNRFALLHGRRRDAATLHFKVESMNTQNTNDTQTPSAIGDISTAHTTATDVAQRADRAIAAGKRATRNAAESVQTVAASRRLRAFMHRPLVASDPPTLPPEMPTNPVTPEPPKSPVTPPPSEDPVPVREPPEVRPPVAASANNGSANPPAGQIVLLAGRAASHRPRSHHWRRPGGRIS